jgi:chemotaxis protein MotA
MRLDFLSMVGLVGGAAVLVVAIFLGGNANIFWSLSAVLITVGGTFCATMLTYGLQELSAAFKALRYVFSFQLRSPQELIELFVELARKARREGLLGLEDDIDRLDDPFFKKSLRLMVDALEPEAIKDILNIDIETTRERHLTNQGVFKTLGTYAPSFGMAGTLIGLVNMLSQLDDPASLGPSMAVALLTTFYGMIMAYLFFLPIAGKLEQRSRVEILNKELMLEAVISIQSGINPRILEERLWSFLSPDAAKEEKEEGRAYENAPQEG